MIIKYTAFALLLFIFSCSNIEFVLKDNDLKNPLKNNTMLLVDKNSEERFMRGLYSNFGNNEKYEYILKTTFLEKKENRIVKNNQVAEKTEYTLEINYDLFYKQANVRFTIRRLFQNFLLHPNLLVITLEAIGLLIIYTTVASIRI